MKEQVLMIGTGSLATLSGFVEAVGEYTPSVKRRRDLFIWSSLSFFRVLISSLMLAREFQLLVPVPTDDLI